MKKIFSLLSLSLLILFSSNLMASSSKPKKSKEETNVSRVVGLGTTPIDVKCTVKIEAGVLTQPIEDECAVYVRGDEKFSTNIKETNFVCGSTVYRFEQGALEPGLYIRAGERLLYKRF